MQIASKDLPFPALVPSTATVFAIGAPSVFAGRSTTQCTNIDELCPRLLYISDCQNVRISGVRLINPPFWTTHLYRCNMVKLLNLYIFSPYEPIKVPNTVAVDVNACQDILIKNCYMPVNDDAVALKGGKGPWVDQGPNNGGNVNFIIEDCTYGYCHSALTCGSESIHNRNIMLRRCNIRDASRLLWLKMRPDTPQNMNIFWWRIS